MICQKNEAPENSAKGGFLVWAILSASNTAHVICANAVVVRVGRLTSPAVPIPTDGVMASRREARGEAWHDAADNRSATAGPAICSRRI